MGWLGEGALPITAGWGGPPQLHAAPIGDLVNTALANKLARDKMLQDTIASTIKEIQKQRQDQAYLEAAQRAGVLPEGDYSGLGGVYAKTLADQYRERKEAQSLEDYRAKLGQRLDTLSTGSDTGSEGPDQYTDEQGRLWYRTKSGWHLAAGWSQPTEARPQSQYQQQTELGRLIKRQAELDTLQKLEETANITAKKPNVHFSLEREYNANQARINQLQGQQTPSQQTDTGTDADTGATSAAPPPADQNLAPNTPQARTTIPPGSGTGGIKPEHIQMLIQHPEWKGYFEEIYGPGSATPYLQNR